MRSSNARTVRWVAIAATVNVMLLAGACGTTTADDTTTGLPASTTPTSQVVSTTEAQATTTATQSPSTTTPETMTVPDEASGPVVYFFVDDVGGPGTGPHLVPVYRGSTDEDTPESAMTALLAGPNTDETSGVPAMSTAIPVGTGLLGVTVDDGQATVDLSGGYDDGGGAAGMFGHLAQVVYTLTRYPDIDGVTFAIDGETVEIPSSEGIIIDRPQSREDYTDQLPAIFVDSPAWGQTVHSPVAVSGVANVFEAVFQMTLTDDDGLPLYEDTVMASCGTGCWGDFEVEVEYEIDRPQFGALIVWEKSAQDGSQVNVREYPIQLR